MSSALEAAAAGLFDGFLRRTHLCRPSQLADVVVEEVGQALGASDVVLYLANYEQAALVPVPSKRSPERAEQGIETTMPGRAFATTTILDAAAELPGRRRLWVPILDGTDRMGTLELTVDADDDGGTVAPKLVEIIERYAHAVAQAILSKGLYGDAFEFVRRSRPMSLGAELLWSMLPPLTYATDGLVVSAMLEPPYANGGDAFDYAVNNQIAHFTVLDGMGHGLVAAGVSTFALAAYRHSRRTGLGLAETYATMDAAVAEQFGDRFVTAVLAQLDLSTGTFRWVSAGHPPPLLIRQGRVVKVLVAAPATPLGAPSSPEPVTVSEESLEPGDVVLLYTDGLTEARQPDGAFLTLEGLAGFVQREATAERSAPEMLRRFRRGILAHQQGVLHDDATALLIEWRRGGEDRLLPQTVK